MVARTRPRSPPHAARAAYRRPWPATSPGRGWPGGIRGSFASSRTPIRRPSRATTATRFARAGRGALSASPASVGESGQPMQLARAAPTAGARRGSPSTSSHGARFRRELVPEDPPDELALVEERSPRPLLVGPHRAHGTITAGRADAKISQTELNPAIETTTSAVRTRPSASGTSSTTRTSHRPDAQARAMQPACPRRAAVTLRRAPHCGAPSSPGEPRSRSGRGGGHPRRRPHHQHTRVSGAGSNYIDGSRPR